MGQTVPGASNDEAHMRSSQGKSRRGPGNTYYNPLKVLLIVPPCLGANIAESLWKLIRAFKPSQMFMRVPTMVSTTSETLWGSDRLFNSFVRVYQHKRIKLWSQVTVSILCL